jgi:hypothetical protein
MLGAHAWQRRRFDQTLVLTYAFPQPELRPFWLRYLPGRLAMEHGTRISSLAAEHLSPAPGEVTLRPGPIVSDSGELVWDDAAGGGRVLIDALRHQAVIGHRGKHATGNLTVDLKTPFAAIEVASQYGRPLAQAERLLLVAAARATNTGFEWVDESRQPVKEWGHAPTRIEPVEAVITLHHLAGAAGLTLQALDGHGQPAGEPRAFARSGDAFSIELPGPVATVWYLIAVGR